MDAGLREMCSQPGISIEDAGMCDQFFYNVIANASQCYYCLLANVIHFV